MNAGHCGSASFSGTKQRRRGETSPIPLTAATVKAREDKPVAMNVPPRRRQLLRTRRQRHCPWTEVAVAYALEKDKQRRQERRTTSLMQRRRMKTSVAAAHGQWS